MLAIVVERVVFFELLDMVDPWREILFKSPAGGGEILKSGPRIGHMRPCHVFHLADLGRVHVEMRDLRVRHRTRQFYRLRDHRIVRRLAMRKSQSSTA